MKAKKEFYSTIDVLQIFRQLCAGLKHMHSFDPPYAHNDVKPGNVLITHKKRDPPLAILMDFGSARPARKEIRSRSEALQLQEWAAEHCSAPFRAPELWDCPSHANIDERTDIFFCSLSTTSFASNSMSIKSKPASRIVGLQRLVLVVLPVEGRYFVVTVRQMAPQPYHAYLL